MPLPASDGGHVLGFSRVAVGGGPKRPPRGDLLTAGAPPAHSLFEVLFWTSREDPDTLGLDIVVPSGLRRRRFGIADGH